ncbi:sulfotransferase family protein [Pseudomonas alliivorans]|nr:sulfotransferase family protein [Pseudomonas alliivorans]MEE4687981.1 sulfotransferase family protein [Pseudomonas alliivorans]MEE4745172.1 sulfotransferase family protein [Pseudomonas alliivorans]MEE5093895.1 sulfotransferase family protein [Pseudomonas alliivorans]MEE5147717.1 sulfotransferase family protein [Pseudomonas alliivorans]
MNRMIALWAHPRSRSTVLERVFIERKDFQVFHEPFAHMAFGPDSAIPSDEWNEQIPHTYQGIKNMLLDARQHGNVFHKDMCYHCEEELKSDPEFLLQQTNVFLIREPIRSILSHHSIYPDMPVEAIGHKSMYEVFCAVTKLTGKIPYVINADDLANDPENVMRTLCDHIEIEFVPEAMTWKTECPEQWKTWRSWHTAAEQSERISRPTNEAVDMQRFNEHPKLRAYYDFHRPYYERMNVFCQQ